MFFFFFNDTATTEIYTLSLHDALPIYHLLVLHQDLREVEQTAAQVLARGRGRPESLRPQPARLGVDPESRSEEHTSELQSRLHLVCRLLLEKKKQNKRTASLVTCRSAC